MVKNEGSSVAQKVVDSTLTQTPKPVINNFITNLFNISMSEDVLVDIVIDDNLGENKVTIVGRPKLLGSSRKQMRHVTPYAFIESAIKHVVMGEGQEGSGYKVYIDQIVSTMKPLLKNKRGICLTSEEYSKLLLRAFLQDQRDEVVQFITITPEKQHNKHYLVHNDALIDAFKEEEKTQTDKVNEAFTRFNNKFEKYIDYGIKYLTDNIINTIDPNVVTMTCEGLARIILTMFNQDKYAAFPQEGNSLLEEIRLYKSKEDEKKNRAVPLQRQRENRAFEVKSHYEITKDITSNPEKESGSSEPKRQKLSEDTYDRRIRIVDNEGFNIRKIVEVLGILDYLVSAKITGHSNPQLIKGKLYDYNSRYTQYVKIKGSDSKRNVNESITENNLGNIYCEHVAVLLYVVFDLKPLEPKVFAPRQRGENNTIKVYPSATEDKTAEYSVQDGDEYRELQYNSRKGYNNKARFRSEMMNKELKEVLCKKIVSHIIISLIPFPSIKAWRTQNHTTDGMERVFMSFVELVRKDYESAQSKDKSGNEVKLDDEWVQTVYREYGDQVKPSTAMDDVKNVSMPAEENYLAL